MRRILLTLSLIVVCTLCLAFAGRPAAGAPAAPAATMLLRMWPVTISANDIVYDWKRDRLYASVSGDQGFLGNSIVPITPDGRTQPPIVIGSEPNVLAISSDAEYLYVGLDGAAAVRRLNLTTLTPEPQWPIGLTTACGPALASAMVVLAGDPDAVAISRTGCWPSPDGVAVYDNGPMRPVTTPHGTLHHILETSLDPNVLFSMDLETSEVSLHRLTVGPDGVTVEKTVRSTFGPFYPGFYFVHAGSELYGSNGGVVDGATLLPLGRFQPSVPGDENRPVAADSAAGQVFFLTEYYTGGQKIMLEVFDRESFRLITAAELPNFSGEWPDNPVEMLPAGPNRLAFRTSNGGVYWLEYTLMAYTTYTPVVARGLWEPGSGR